MQRPLDPGLHFPCVESEVERAEGDVSADGGAEELIFGVLKQQADSPPDLIGVLSGCREAIDEYSGGVGIGTGRGRIGK